MSAVQLSTIAAVRLQCRSQVTAIGRSGAIVDNCTALIGYKTYPHTDMYEVADQIGQVLFAGLTGNCVPTMAWR